MTVMRIRILAVFPVFVVICQQGMDILIQHRSSLLTDEDYGSYDRCSSEKVDRTVDDVVPKVQFPSEQETCAYVKSGGQAGIVCGDESSCPGAFPDEVEFFIYSAVLAVYLVFLTGQTEMKKQEYDRKESAD